MDTDKILLAIDEKKKWEARTVEIESQLNNLKNKKTTLHTELKSVDEKVKYYSALADSFREYSVSVASGRYYVDGKGPLR